MQPNIAALWWGNFKNAVYLTVNEMENIPQSFLFFKSSVLNPNIIKEEKLKLLIEIYIEEICSINSSFF